MDIWIFLAENRSNDVLQHLLERKLRVEAITSSLTIESPISTVLAVRCNADDLKQTKKSVYDFLSAQRIQCYGVVLLHNGHILWDGSNDLPRPTAQPQEPPHRPTSPEPTPGPETPSTRFYDLLKDD